MLVFNFKLKKDLKQMQLTDYIFGTTIEVYRMWVPHDYYLARKKYKKILHGREYKKKVKLVNYEDYHKIDEYILKVQLKTLPKPRYLLRFLSVNKCTYEDFAKGKIPKREWDMLHGRPNATGHFNHIFELNDLSFFDKLHQDLESRGAKFGKIFLKDIIIIELARRLMGLNSYAAIERVFSFSGISPVIELMNNPAYKVRAVDISKVMRQIPPEKLMEYFLSLVKEVIALKIIVPRILVADGQFIRTNSNNNRPNGSPYYTDRDAGYCRHNGVKKGVGYKIWGLYGYCGTDRVIPVYFKVYPGNRSDKIVSKETLDEFVKLGIGEWKIIVMDAGAYSKGNLEFIKSLGIFPIIRARKGLKTHPTRELKKGYWFNTKYIPDGWTDDEFLAIYKIRPMVEKALARHSMLYNGLRMNTRGKANAIRHRVLYYIIDLLRVLTGYKLGRPDLMDKLTAFSSVRKLDLSWTDPEKYENY